jgi:hypothetical protein
MGAALEVVRRLYERIDDNDVEATVERLAPEVDFVMPGVRLHGRGEVRAFLVSHWEAFGSHRHDIVSAVEAEDAIVVEAAVTATHTGPLGLPSGVVAATGRTAHLPICQVIRCQAGLIVTSHIYFDPTELLAQLGLLPVPAA